MTILSHPSFERIMHFCAHWLDAAHKNEYFYRNSSINITDNYCLKWKNKQKQRHKCINKRFFQMNRTITLDTLESQDRNNIVIYLPSMFIPQVIGYLYNKYLSDSFFHQGSPFSRRVYSSYHLGIQHAACLGVSRIHVLSYVSLNLYVWSYLLKNIQLFIFFYCTPFNIPIVLILTTSSVLTLSVKCAHTNLQ